MRAQPMAAFLAAAQHYFQVKCGDFFAASARLEIGTCLLWAQSRLPHCRETAVPRNYLIDVDGPKPPSVSTIAAALQHP